MANLQNGRPAKCFPGILRSLLCTGSLPTHPTDHLHEFKTPVQPTDHTSTEWKLVQPAPGIIARLMGLDSLPLTTPSPRGRTTLESIPRSKSANYETGARLRSLVPDFPVLDPTKKSQHRRVKTSPSFPEVLTSLHQENRELFTLFVDEPAKAEERLCVRAEKEKGAGIIKICRDRSERNGVGTREKGDMEKKKRMEETKEKKGNGFKKNSPKDRSELSGKKQSCRKQSATVEVKTTGKTAFSRGASSEMATKMNHHLHHHHHHHHHRNKDSRLGFANSHRGFPAGPRHTRRSEKLGTVGANSRTPATDRKKDDLPPKMIRGRVKVDDRGVRATKYKDITPLNSRETDSDFQRQVCRITEGETSDSVWMAGGAFEFRDLEEMCSEFAEKILDGLLYPAVDEI